MASTNETCNFQTYQIAVLGLLDTLTVLIGQPLVACLLWLTFTSKRAHLDVLNINLALFHNCQFGMSLAHLCIMLGRPRAHIPVLQSLLAYAQTGGPMSLCLICMERYVAVLHPTYYSYLRQYPVRELCAAAVWLVSLPVAFFVGFTERVFNPSMGHAYKIIPFCVLVPMVVLVHLSSVRITQTLRQAGPGKAMLHPSKRRALNTVQATSVLTLLCYIPVSVLTQLRMDKDVTMCLLTPICVTLLSVASVVHPACYLYTHLK